MTFRRNKSSSLRWQTWRQQNYDALSASGVPMILLDDMSNWLYFLDHGSFTPPGITSPLVDVNHMSQTDATQLCSFLEQDNFYPDSHALNRLQFLLKRGPHAPKPESTQD